VLGAEESEDKSRIRASGVREFEITVTSSAPTAFVWESKCVERINESSVWSEPLRTATMLRIFPSRWLIQVFVKSIKFRA
jgi:hypothetical protein